VSLLNSLHGLVNHRTFKFILFGIGLCVLMSSCATSNLRTVEPEYSGSFQSAFSKAIEKYQTRKPHRAFAIALDVTGHWSYGSAFGYTSQLVANVAAMGECRRQRRVYKVKSDCKVYAEGDNIMLDGKVWGSLDFNAGMKLEH